METHNHVRETHNALMETHNDLWKPFLFAKVGFHKWLAGVLNYFSKLIFIIEVSLEFNFLLRIRWIENCTMIHNMEQISLLPKVLADFLKKILLGPDKTDKAYLGSKLGKN